MRKITFLPSVLFAICLLLNQGCVALVVGAAVGAGGVTYANGKLVRNFDAPVGAVHKAAVAGLKSLKVLVTDENVSTHSAVVKFEFLDGKKGQITISALTERASKMIIRIGYMGDQEKSQMILNAIENKF